MVVIFRKTGERRYAVIVEVPGQAPQTMNPAPGFDPYIPHDLVHYAVEAELELTGGVFGRAASGGGTFVPAGPADDARAQARQRRKQQRRENSLRHADARAQQMSTSEHLAYLCDLAWRRRHGQRPDPSRWHEPAALSPEDATRVARVVTRLDALASVWNALPLDGELAFHWPSLEPRKRLPSRTNP